jgi:hypothetical protein
VPGAIWPPATVLSENTFLVHFDAVCTLSWGTQRVVAAPYLEKEFVIYQGCESGEENERPKIIPFSSDNTCKHWMRVATVLPAGLPQDSSTLHKYC